MDTDPSKSSFDFGDTKSRSPLRKLTEKNVIGRMLSRTKLGAKLSIDESFDMVPDFDPVDRKGEREDGYLLSPQRKQHRSASPPPPSRAPPVAYRPPQAKQSLPPRMDSIPVLPPNHASEPSSIPLPASPSRSASSRLPYPPQLSTNVARPGTPIAEAPHSAPLQGRSRSQPPHPPTSPDIFADFDKLFADFPRPPQTGHNIPPRPATRAGQHHAQADQHTGRHHLVPTPALTSASSSAYSTTSSNPHSRTVTPLSPYPPPDPTRLESAINTLSQVVLCLQGTQADHATYTVRQANLEAKLQGMERDLKTIRAENVRLEVEVRREREERERAEREKERVKEGMEKKLIKAEEAKVEAITSLQTLQSTSQRTLSQLNALQIQLHTSQTQTQALLSRNKDLEAAITRLNGAFDLVKHEYQVKEEEMRKRMEEAEFMHRALKESGARLGRELAGAKRRYSELEKKGRGGFI